MDVADLARLSARTGVPFIEDLGSGALVDLEAYGLPHERTVPGALRDGAGIVAFSGDKLFGGPQCGVPVGRANLIARLRNNPLVRALRVDKMTLAALSATLQLHRTPETRTRIPLYRMLATTLDELHVRAVPYLAAMRGGSAVEADAYTGGGVAAASAHRFSRGFLAVKNPTAFSRRAAAREPRDRRANRADRVLFDLRTIAPEEDDSVIATVTYGAPEIFEA